MTGSVARARICRVVLAAGMVGPCAASAGLAQEPPSKEASPVIVRQASPPDSVRRPVSPLGALGRSILVPGWGQASVGQPVRGAFYFAMEAGSLFMVVRTQARLSAARRALPVDTALVRSRTQQREDWIVLSVFWALLSGVDAWVSAHLWHFEGAVVPPDDGSAGMALKFRVPVAGP